MNWKVIFWYDVWIFFKANASLNTVMFVFTLLVFIFWMGDLYLELFLLLWFSQFCISRFTRNTHKAGVKIDATKYWNWFAVKWSLYEDICRRSGRNAWQCGNHNIKTNLLDYLRFVSSWKDHWKSKKRSIMSWVVT